MDEHLERQYLEVELYEKIIVRERRKKTLLITAALMLFLFLCGIPIYNERLPKWESLSTARQIAVEIEQLKTESLHLKKPLLLSLLENGQLRIERVAHCGTLAEVPIVEALLHEKSWTNDRVEIALMNEAEAKKANLNQAVQKICFDPVSGLSSGKNKKVIVVVPVKDLANSRLDRASYVEIETSSARITIN